jgi:hypothetical protein
METVNAKEGIDTMNTTTHLTKIGNAYATADLRYYVKRDAAGYRLHDRDSRVWWHLGRNKAEALTIAEKRLNTIIGARTVEPRTVAADMIWTHDEKHYYYGDINSCQCCGRKVGANPIGIIVVNGGASLCHPEDHKALENDGGYMGWFPIGSECAKRIPAEYLTR